MVTAKEGANFREPAKTASRVRMVRRTITGHAVGMRMLALNLSNALGRRLIDETGLSGAYNFELKWAAETRQFAGDPRRGVEAPSDSDTPSLFTALSDPLGLRLQSQKGPLEVLVIDRVEKPTDN